MHFYGIGVDDQGEKYIVTEFMSEGALNHFVLKNRNLSNQDMIEMFDIILVETEY